MAQLYDLEFNKNDVVLRNILVGVLATLNNRMYWYNQISQTEKKKINVPFYFSTTGDERFLMDSFMNDVAYEDPTLPSGKAEGPYNKIPRGIIQLDGINIDAGSMTNKFVRAFYQRVQTDGTLKTLNSEVFMIPLKLPFTCEIYVDSNLDIFKAIQRIIEIFYKHQVFQVDIDGTRIPAMASLPEDFEKERPLEYTFSDAKKWKVSFSIEVNTFMPIFKNAENGFGVDTGSVGADSTGHQGVSGGNTEMDASKVMGEISQSAFVKGGIPDGIVTMNGNSIATSPYISSSAWPINPPGGENNHEHPTGGTHNKGA